MKSLLLAATLFFSASLAHAQRALDVFVESVEGFATESYDTVDLNSIRTVRAPRLARQARLAATRLAHSPIRVGCASRLMTDPAWARRCLETLDLINGALAATPAVDFIPRGIDHIHVFLDTPSAGPGGVRGRQFLLNAMAPIAERRALLGAFALANAELTRTERARGSHVNAVLCDFNALSPRNAEGRPLLRGMEQAQSCATTARALELFLGSWHSGLLHSRFGTITLGGTDGFERRGVIGSGDELVIDVRVSPASSTRENLNALKPLIESQEDLVNLLGVHTLVACAPQTTLHTCSEYLRRLRDELASSEERAATLRYTRRITLGRESRHTTEDGAGTARILSTLSLDATNATTLHNDITSIPLLLSAESGGFIYHCQAANGAEEPLFHCSWELTAFADIEVHQRLFNFPSNIRARTQVIFRTGAPVSHTPDNEHFLDTHDEAHHTVTMPRGGVDGIAMLRSRVAYLYTNYHYRILDVLSIPFERDDFIHFLQYYSDPALLRTANALALPANFLTEHIHSYLSPLIQLLNLHRATPWPANEELFLAELLADESIQSFHPQRWFYARDLNATRELTLYSLASQQIGRLLSILTLTSEERGILSHCNISIAPGVSVAPEIEYELVPSDFWTETQLHRLRHSANDLLRSPTNNGSRALIPPQIQRIRIHQGPLPGAASPSTLYRISGNALDISALALGNERASQQLHNVITTAWRRYLRGISPSRLMRLWVAHQETRSDTVRTPSGGRISFKGVISDILPPHVFDAYTPIHSIMRKLRPPVATDEDLQRYLSMSPNDYSRDRAGRNSLENYEALRIHRAAFFENLCEP